MSVLVLSLYNTEIHNIPVSAAKTGEKMLDRTSGYNTSTGASGGARAPARDAVDLRRAVVLVRKHKWSILLVTALVTALTAVAVSLLNPVYRSTVTILFGDNQSETGFERSAVELQSGRVGSIVETQKEVLKSRSLARRVVNKLELTNHWEYNPKLPVPDEFKFNGPLGRLAGDSSLGAIPDAAATITNVDTEELSVEGQESLHDRAVAKLMRSVQVIPLKKTELITVSIDSRDSKLAPEIANTYAVVLKEFYIEQSTSRDSDARQFLENKVSELKQKLDDSEQELLRERRRVGLSGDGGDISGQTIALLNSRLVDAKAQFELARIQWNQVRSISGSSSPASLDDVTFSEVRAGASSDTSIASFEYLGTPYELLPIVDSNPVVQRRKQEVQESLRIVEELDNRYGIKHPRVIDAQSNYLTSARNLDRQIANVISSVESEFQVSERQVASIEADIRREENRQFDRNTGRLSIKEIELARDSHKQFYEEALQEFRSYEERNLQTVPMSVADPAVQPNTAAKPRKALMVLLAFLLSSGGMIFLTYMFEGLKESVQGINDIEKKLKLPVFGILPTVKGRFFSDKSVPLIPGCFEDRRGAFAEAVWTIRTSATVAELEDSNQVIMVTSTVPGEGKSTLATNLAYALSELENVLLLEADMRRPGIGKALAIRADGLHEVLTGKIYLEDSVKVNAIDDLDVIPAGRPAQSPGKLLASPEFGELIDLLKERYDRVVIDLAPIQAVSDALIVGKYVDTAIYVVKADSTPLPMVSRGIDRLTQNEIDVSGVVISQVDFNKISGYGGDYYYQGYYDYYGYGEKEKELKQKSSGEQQDNDHQKTVLLSRTSSMSKDGGVATLSAREAME